MLIGTTSFALRYQLLNASVAPPLTSLLEPLRLCGAEALQICENARPWEFSAAAWREIITRASDLDLKLSVGCMTADATVFRAHMDMAQRLDCRTVRVILEFEGSAASPGSEDVRRFLDTVTPWLLGAGQRAAIENHFALPCRILREAAGAYPPEAVGFCLDTANSLRCFEDEHTVFHLLGSRALCYHVKDYRVYGSNVGFTVGGAPLGCGHLALHAVAQRILQGAPNPQIFIENWVPASGDAVRDGETDLRWLALGIAKMRALTRP